MATWRARFSNMVMEEYADVQTLVKVGKDIAELNLDLQLLHQEWREVLSANPTELWEPSINAFHSSRVLVRTDNSSKTWSAASCVQASRNGYTAGGDYPPGTMILLSQRSRRLRTLSLSYLRTKFSTCLCCHFMKWTPHSCKFLFH
jgi:hypothetical protein